MMCVIMNMLYFPSESDLPLQYLCRMVRLGPVLTSLLHQKGVEDLEEMSWNELMKRFMSELRPAYKLMLANGEEFVRYCIVYSLEKALQKLITSFFVSKFPITGKYWLK